MNVVEAAVLPLKEAAVARAEEEGRKLIAKILADLAKFDFDVNKAAPRPSNYASRSEYSTMIGKHNLYCEVTIYAKTSLRVNEPNIRLQSDEREARFIKMVREDAAAQYDAFVAKLVSKVGEAVDATLEGSHVWGYSFLTVTAPDNTKTVWKTQQIVNVSKLGKLFNQWPTRKQK